MALGSALPPPHSAWPSLESAVLLVLLPPTKSPPASLQHSDPRGGLPGLSAWLRQHSMMALLPPLHPQTGNFHNQGPLRGPEVTTRG